MKIADSPQMEILKRRASHKLFKKAVTTTKIMVSMMPEKSQVKTQYYGRKLVDELEKVDTYAQL